MKKWIKKLSIGSVGIAAIGGGVGVISIMHKQKISDTKTFYYGTAQAAVDRYYCWTLSIQVTKNLFSYMKTSDKTTIGLGNSLYYYLTHNIKIANNDFSAEFKGQIWSSGDHISVNQLFKNQNSHTWKMGFDINLFYKNLQEAANENAPIFLNIYVDYVFLGHNKYAADYSHLL